MWYDKKRQDSFMEYGRTVVGNGFMTEEDWEAMVRGDPLPDTDANDAMGAESKARRSNRGVSLSDFD
jgi:hypothetical protein